jgi:hypothetical protein
VYYQRSKADQWAKRQANKAALVERNRAIIREALAVGCSDCGTEDIRVLEFDHLGDKEFGISQIRDGAEERLRAEIAKCEVVCANCHRIRTYTRSGCWRIA